jgi:hypothetical protein
VVSMLGDGVANITRFPTCASFDFKFKFNRFPSNLVPLVSSELNLMKINHGGISIPPNPWSPSFQTQFNLIISVPVSRDTVMLVRI